MAKKTTKKSTKKKTGKITRAHLDNSNTLVMIPVPANLAFQIGLVLGSDLLPHN